MKRTIAALLLAALAIPALPRASARQGADPGSPLMRRFSSCVYSSGFQAQMRAAQQEQRR